MRTIFALITISLWIGPRSVDASRPETFPLGELQSGMRAFWHTVVSGTDIEIFELRVLGVIDHHVGPQTSAVICEVVDEAQRRIGPVAGMSGSPVYAEDGRLIGAYAYGYPWSKDQAIVAITPVSEMLEIIDQFPLEPPTRHRPASHSRAPSINGLSEPNPAPNLSGDDLAIPPTIGNPVRSTPLLFNAVGFSTRTISAFREPMLSAGIDMLGAQSGGQSDLEAESLPLEPGSPMAAVLMTGDFSVAATGTVTWREGDNVVGFGHPFLQGGQQAFPLAGAEILGIVQTAPQSFKLSRTGPIVGTIYQDRLTAVAGRIGEIPPLIEFSITADSDQGKARRFAGELLEHATLTPMLIAMALYESLYATLESGEEQTLFLTGELLVEGYEPIRFSESGAGPFGDFRLASRLLEDLRDLMRNPFAMPRIRAIHFQLRRQAGYAMSYLREVHVDNQRVRPGDTITVGIALGRHHGDPEIHRLSVPVPEHVRRGDTVSLLFGDAQTVDRLDGVAEMPVTSVGDILRRWENRSPSSFLYVRLLRPAEGMNVEGYSMRALPPSVLAQLRSPAYHFVGRPLTETTLWKHAIPVHGIFNGSYRVDITIE